MTTNLLKIPIWFEASAAPLSVWCRVSIISSSNCRTLTFTSSTSLQDFLNTGSSFYLNSRIAILLSFSESYIILGHSIKLEYNHSTYVLSNSAISRRKFCILFDDESQLTYIYLRFILFHILYTQFWWKVNHTQLVITIFLQIEIKKTAAW